MRDQLDRNEMEEAFKERTGVSIYSDNIKNLRIQFNDGEFHNEKLQRVPILEKKAVNLFLGGFSGGHMDLRVDDISFGDLYFNDYKNIRLTFDYKGVHQNILLFGNSKLEK